MKRMLSLLLVLCVFSLASTASASDGKHHWTNPNIQVREADDPQQPPPPPPKHHKPHHPPEPQKPHHPPEQEPQEHEHPDK